MRSGTKEAWGAGDGMGERVAARSIRRNTRQGRAPSYPQGRFDPCRYPKSSEFSTAIPITLDGRSNRTV